MNKEFNKAVINYLSGNGTSNDKKLIKDFGFKPGITGVGYYIESDTCNIESITEEDNVVEVTRSLDDDTYNKIANNNWNDVKMNIDWYNMLSKHYYKPFTDEPVLDSKMYDIINTTQYIDILKDDIKNKNMATMQSKLKDALLTRKKAIYVPSSEYNHNMLKEYSW